jgi:hypothetical protein
MGLATGEWILQHHDDCLLPDAGPVILETIRRTPLVSGACGVDVHGVVGRRQRFRQERDLEPELALCQVLCNSSFVRQPAAVVHRQAVEDEGWYDTTLGGPCDTDMWVRLFSRYDVRCVPATTCAYTTHQGAATTTMWRPDTIRAACEMFDRAVARGVVPVRSIRRWEADFFHQFILVGAYRSLRLRQRAEARDVLRLFDLPELRHLGASPKWLPVRVALTAARRECASETNQLSRGRSAFRWGGTAPVGPPSCLDRVTPAPLVTLLNSQWAGCVLPCALRGRASSKAWPRLRPRSVLVAQGDR